jgi:tRNA-binding EMAP/Myf-like protein
LVEKIEDHPEEKKWKVVTVSLSNSEKFKVVCGGKGYSVNDIIAYAKIGSKINKKKIIKTNMKGVESEGMILSEFEFGGADEEEEEETENDKKNDKEKKNKKEKKKEEKEKIYLFPKETKVGMDVIELGRFEDCKIDKNTNILEEITLRNKQISEILQKMESKEEGIFQPITF